MAKINAINLDVTPGGGFTYTFPSATCTLAGLEVAQTFTALQTVALDNATTNAIDTLLDLQHSSSGTVAANFGAAIRFGLESSTTTNQLAGNITYSWLDATHASRKSTITASIVTSGTERTAFGYDPTTNSGAGSFDIYRSDSAAKNTQIVPNGNDTAFINPNGTFYIGTSIAAFNVAFNKSGSGFINVVSGGMYGFSSSASEAAFTGPDTGISRNAAGVVELNNGTAGSYRDLKLRTLTALGTSGETTVQGIVEENVTLSTAGATTDTTIDLPADSLIDAVTIRITTTITGIDSTSLQFGDSNVATRFGSVSAFTSGTTGVGINQWKGSVTADNAGPTQTSTAKVRLTLAGGADNTPSAGAVRVAIHYRTFTAPTA